ncbi:hypothetical protein BpHYR1_045384 [Brachionus plicatilis]|uniref:Uncharacterized protein n=1 Tax=Brachionus plicatilis TaxID=10195 RepID=A0A3M7PTL0_BRAPC|nr:hypothetical protein BpHYR1_045384 [Brachionus plicatilis]
MNLTVFTRTYEYFRGPNEFRCEAGKLFFLPFLLFISELKSFVGNSVFSKRSKLLYNSSTH